jgi:hypothetical protein
MSAATRARCAIVVSLGLSALGSTVVATASANDVVRAGRNARVADKSLVAKAKNLGACQRRHTACNGQNAALQAAGRAATTSQTRLAKAARTRSAATAAPASLAAPSLRVSPDTIAWNQVANVTTYVVVTKVPGKAFEYTVVSGTSFTPKAYPGKLVVYSVRTALDGSSWATERSVRFPRSTPAGRTNAPVLSMGGDTLRWNRVSDVADYVVRATVGGRDDAYSVVRGVSVAPQAVPGQSVTYSVRTAVTGSAWSVRRTVSYPAAPVVVTKDAPAPASDPAPGADPAAAAAPAAVVKATPAAPASQPAPAPAPAPKPVYDPPAPAASTDRTTITVDGTTLRWAPIPGAAAYVMVAKTAGRADAYSMVTGTSTTPAAQPDRSVAYSVRADIDGALWAFERTIAYPAAAPAPAPAGGPFTAGINSGSALLWELPFISTLHAKSARMEFAIDTPVSEMGSAIEAYARAGVQPLLLAGFPGQKPTVAQGAKLAAWAEAFGPGGTFWAGKNLPARVAVQHIEFGNETSYSWQYPTISGDGNWANTAFYRDLATKYAEAFKAASTGIKAANPQVDLLAVGDTPGNWGTWMDGLFSAVPNFGSYVGGWTVHPYGPEWKSRIDSVTEKAQSHGAASSIPLFATEVGLSTDDGRCLSDNYGWDPCMSYAKAATTLDTLTGDLRSTYGGRMGGIWLYQAHDQQTPAKDGDREHYFGGLTYGGTSKGAFTTAVESFLGTSA